MLGTIFFDSQVSDQLRVAACSFARRVRALSRSANLRSKGFSSEPIYKAVTPKEP